jgi:2-aminobenzoylacetyl-CoA thioesterase
MIFATTGAVNDKLYVTGLPWAPCYLLAGARPVLFDAGLHCAGRLYAKEIEGTLGPRRPGVLFLSHVHWDHCGAAAYLKKLFPHMLIAASAKARATMKRSHAIELMDRLNREMIPLVETAPGVDADFLIRSPFEPFGIDMILDDGQSVSLGEDMTVQVFSSPGHTWDMLSYYIPEEKILVAGEAAGLLWHNGGIGVEFLVDYDEYVKSLTRLAGLDVDILCQGHYLVLTGDDVKEFFDRSIEATGQFGADVEKWLNGGDGSIDRAAALMKAKEYDTNTGLRQPEESYLINLRIKVAHLAKRLGRFQPGGRPRNK